VMGVLDGDGDHQMVMGSFGVNVGHPIAANWILYGRGGDVALPKFLWDFLVWD